ncbi:MAG: TenA family protein, partial [Acidobacteria bacterium]|nr:TenA family protein [Acidobacteriota bacterium]
MTRRSLLVFPAAAWLPPSDFSRQLWTAIASIYTKTLVHPFLTGLQDGSLPRRKFQFYLLQDALYLGVFSRVLNVLASKAPRQEWAVSLGRDAIEAVDVERAMHRQILGSYGISPQQIANADMAPVNYAYTNHLMITAERGSFAEGLAAVLPCYWIYWEVGKELKKRGSRNRDYER